MTDSKNTNQTEPAVRRQPATERASSPPVFVYESAGISERKGNVPIWLWLVVASLLIWGVYYLVAYWNAPITPT